jgi:LDH2 family malate/lactate/ureidoglycolate dehydrogenase
LEKAGKSGFALAGTNNTSTSSGAIGYFARKIAEADYIGFVLTESVDSGEVEIEDKLLEELRKAAV